MKDLGSSSLTGSAFFDLSDSIIIPSAVSGTRELVSENRNGKKVNNNFKILTNLIVLPSPEEARQEEANPLIVPSNGESPEEASLTDSGFLSGLNVSIILQPAVSGTRELVSENRNSKDKILTDSAFNFAFEEVSQERKKEEERNLEEEFKEFEVVAEDSWFDKLYNYAYDNRELIYSRAMFCSKAIKSGMVLYSTATALMYAPNIMALGVLNLAVIHLIDKTVDETKEYKLSKFAFGAAAASSGLGLAVPIVHKIAVASVAGSITFCGVLVGIPSLLNPATTFGFISTSILGVMTSKVGYFGTMLSSFALYSLIESQKVQSIIKTAISEYVTQPIQWQAAVILHQKVEDVRNIRFGTVLGPIVNYVNNNFILPAVNNKIEQADNVIKDHISKLGNNGKDAIFGNIEKIGETYLENLTFLPVKAYEYYTSKFNDDFIWLKGEARKAKESISEHSRCLLNQYISKGIGLSHNLANKVLNIDLLDYPYLAGTAFAVTNCIIPLCSSSIYVVGLAYLAVNTAALYKIGSLPRQFVEVIDNSSSKFKDIVKGIPSESIRIC